MNKRRLILIFTVFSIILLFGCKNNITTEDNNVIIDENEKESEKVYEPSYGGKLTVPICNVNSINPLLNSDKTFYNFNQLIYEGLFSFDENLNIKNVLADSYEITNGGRSILIKIKDNVFWHSDANEEPKKMTAEDVEFTVNLLRYSADKTVYNELFNKIYNPSNPKDLQHILRVRVIDEFNLKIDFDRPYSNALESLVFPILSKKQFDIGSSITKAYEKALSRDLGFLPKGTGPYKIVKYDKLKDVILKSNDNWWKGKPYIENIVGLIIPEKELLIRTFESGKIDLTIAKEVDWEKYADNKDINKFEYITQNYEFLGFNFNNELFKSDSGQAIRKAIAYGIDLNSIIEKIYLGHATQSDVPISPNSWLLNEEYNYYGRDVIKAKELLKEAGYEDRNADGIVEDINGRKLSFRLLTNLDNQLRFKTSQMIISNLKDIGIEIKLQLKYDDINQWDIVKEKLANRDFDIALLGWELSNLSDLSFAFHSSQINGGYNFISYSNEMLDELLVNAFFAENREAKKAVYDKIQKIITDDLPYISLYFKNGSILVNNKVYGDVKPQSFNIYYDIENWFIPEELREENNEKEDNTTTPL